MEELSTRSLVPPRAAITTPATEDAALSLLVLDAELALAEAVARALLQEEGIADVTGTSDPRVAVAALESGAIDVVVVGTDSDDWDPMTFLRTVALRSPEVTLVAMSRNQAPERVTAALLAGAVSWVPKQVGVQELASVVRAAVRGHSSVPPDLLHHVLRRLASQFTGHDRSSAFNDLTPREAEILEYAVLGYSRGETAAELGLSVNTVRTHVQHVLRKLGVNTTLGAVALVLRERATGE